MMRFPISTVALLLLTLVPGGCRTGAPAGQGEPAPPAEPIRVLLLGDSISIGYTEAVRARLTGRAVVVRPTRANGRPENCQGTNHGLEHVDRWLALEGGGWDVVHFNFGLHDLKRVDPATGRNSNDPTDPHQAPPERYRAQLRAITGRLAESGARLCFATTTPIPEGDLRPYRAPGDAVRYNAIAREVMAELDVPVNDLHGYALPRLAELQQPENVHFTREGSAALGRQVALAILDVAGLPFDPP